MTTATDLASLRVKLDLPKHVLDEYERQAEREFGVSLEELLTTRLTECVRHTASKPIYLDDAQRREVEQALHKNIKNAAHLVAELKKTAVVRVSGIDVTLQPELLRRLQSRHLDKSKTFDEFLKRLLTMALEQFVGMR